MTDLADKLEQGLATAWRPDKDDPDLILGTVTEIAWGTSEYNDSGRYPIVTIATEPDGEEKAVHGFHSVLMNELIRQQPQPGERIGIKFLGEVPTKPGSKFKSYLGYRVKVDRQAQAFNWNAIAPEHVDEPAPPAEPEEPVTVPAGAGDDDIPF